MTTSLGSLHEFNGIGDVFHTQPLSNGLNDFYITLNTGNHLVSAEVSAHLFEKTNTSLNKALGFEYDFTGEMHFTPSLTISASYAYFKSKNSSNPSTNKFWITFSAKLL